METTDFDEYGLNTLIRKEKIQIKNKKSLIAIFVFFSINTLLLIIILALMFYGFFTLIPEKINNFSQEIQQIQSYGKDIDDLTLKFNTVYSYIITFCNNTKLCT